MTSSRTCEAIWRKLPHLKIQFLDGVLAMDALLILKPRPHDLDTGGLKVAVAAPPSSCSPRREPVHIFEAHKSVVLEGELARGAFLIVTGAILLSRTTEDGKRHVLAILGAGDVFGVSSGATYEETAETLSFTHVRPIDLVRGEMGSGWSAYVSQQLLKQLHSSRSHMVLLQRRSAEEKIAALILGLPKADSGRATERRIMLSLMDAADYLSLRMETVSRVLSRFRKRGLISIPQRGRLIIHAESELRRIANPAD